jgi:Type IV secretion-system coupling protein DNA-binding domain
MHHPHGVRCASLSLSILVFALTVSAPELCVAQASPFMTGASALQTNILAWLTPIAIILVMVLGGMAMANRIAQVSNTYGADAQTIVENCGNTLILRCSASEHGGTSQFASRLIGEREVLRRQISRGSDREGWFARRGARRSKNTSEQRVTEAAVMPSEIEGLPDFCGYLKAASASEWLKVSFERSRPSDRSGMHGRLRLESKHQRPLP